MPRCLLLDPLGGGTLLMEFIPGSPPDYGQDPEKAARIFARVHTIPVPDGSLSGPTPWLRLLMKVSAWFTGLPTTP